MARITLEDFLQHTSDRFELVVLASQRTRDLESGSPLMVERDNDKNTVVALREIAKGHVNLDALKQSFVQKFRQALEPVDSLEDIKESLEQDSLPA